MTTYKAEVTTAETYAIYEVEAESREEALEKVRSNQCDLVTGPHEWELDIPRIDDVWEVKYA